MKRNSNRVPLKIAEKRKQIEGGFMIHAKEIREKIHSKFYYLTCKKRAEIIGEQWRILPRSRRHAYVKQFRHHHNLNNLTYTQEESSDGELERENMSIQTISPTRINRKYAKFESKGESKESGDIYRAMVKTFTPQQYKLKYRQKREIIKKKWNELERKTRREYIIASEQSNIKINENQQLTESETESESPSSNTEQDIPNSNKIINITSPQDEHRHRERETNRGRIKKPLTAYILFGREKLQLWGGMQKPEEGWKNYILKLWGELDSKDKIKYYKMANDDKDRYNMQIQNYKKREYM